MIGALLRYFRSETYKPGQAVGSKPAVKSKSILPILLLIIVIRANHFKDVKVSLPVIQKIQKLRR
jgi:hypothetical protein